MIQLLTMAGLNPTELACQLLETPEADEGRDDRGDGRGHIGTGIRDSRGNASRQLSVSSGGRCHDESRDRAQAQNEVLFHEWFLHQILQNCSLERTE